MSLMMVPGLAMMGAAAAWSPGELKAELQSFLDAHAGTYAASLAVIGEGYEVSVASNAKVSDRFAFGSGTKPFVGTAVLKLAESGQLHLSDSAATWIDPALDAIAPGATFESLFGSRGAGSTKDEFSSSPSLPRSPVVAPPLGLPRGT